MAMLSHTSLSPALNISKPVGRITGVRSMIFPSTTMSQRQALKTSFLGRRAVVQDDSSFSDKGPVKTSIITQSRLIGKSTKWWEKGVRGNMREVAGAQDLVDSLLNAGDKLVVVDFYSPGCGGCKALHPKICQLAEMNPYVEFLSVNYEEKKAMCHSLNVHVLPFFRFYRGSQGRVCSFSCTNATIKKLKDALAKHSTDRCSIGPPKGIEEKELLALSANKDVYFNYKPASIVVDEEQRRAKMNSILESSLPLPSGHFSETTKETSTSFVVV